MTTDDDTPRTSDLDGLAVYDQPLPTRDPRSVPVLPLAVAPLRHSPHTLWAIAALEQRTRLGVVRYGQPLHTYNGRDSLRDLREEVLDAWQYLTQACAEGRIAPEDALVMEGDLTSLLARLAPKEPTP